jgi:glutathione peroxidase-family protein
MWKHATVQKLFYKRYKDQGFVIVGFPANNFASGPGPMKK